MAVTSISLYYDDPDLEKHEENYDDDEGDDECMPPPPPAPAELERLKTDYRVFDEPSEHWQWNGGALSADASAGVTMIPMAPMVPMVAGYAAPVAMHMQPIPAMANPVDPMPHSMPAHVTPMGYAEQYVPSPGGGALGPAAGGPPMPQTLQRSTSVSTRAARIEWNVDARKLRGNDKQAVSPSFDLSCGGRTLPFKMMIYPKQIPEQRGGASFKKSKGRGSITIKCEADVHHGTTPLTFRIYTGQGVNKQIPRGPVEHDFSASAICTLPRSIEEWDFQEVADRASTIFVVGLEVLTQ